MTENPYCFAGQDEICSPQLIYYPEIIAQNIDLMKKLAGGADRLWPHVKTYKMEKVVEMLLAADSFGELLNRVGYIEQMNTYDQEQLPIYIKNKELVEACKTALEEEQEVLEEAKAEVEEEEAGLETLIGEKEAQITA